MDKLVKTLPLPADYFKGQRSKQLQIPNNVLCWHPHELLVSGPAGYHQHHRFVLMMSVAGSVTVVLDEHMFRLVPEHAILCFPFQQHAFLDADEDRAWLFVTFELADTAHLAPLRNRLVHPGKGVWALAADLARSFLAKNRNNSTCLLTGLLLDEMRESAPSAGPGENLDPNLGLLELVNQAIWKSIHEPIDIQELADQFAISASHLRLLFKRTFGQSMGQYIRETKINRARDLLATTGLTISDVARACGYGSLYSFSRAFKRVTGNSPREYREEARKRK